MTIAVMGFCRQRLRGRRGTSAFEVALSLAVAALLVAPVSFLIARSSAHSQGNSLALEGAAILHTWLDVVPLGDGRRESESQTVRQDENLWLLSYHIEEPMLGVGETSESMSGALALVVAHAQHEDRNIDVVVRRLMVEPYSRDSFGEGQ